MHFNARKIEHGKTDYIIKYIFSVNSVTNYTILFAVMCCNQNI
jgi:hypothetical protein